jgi:hypothetical protein
VCVAIYGEGWAWWYYCTILLTWSVCTDRMILRAIWNRKESCSRLAKFISQIEFEIKQFEFVQTKHSWQVKLSP